MNENINLFYEALTQTYPTEHFDASFNVDIDQLDTGYRTAIERAISEGQLDCFICNGVRLVSSDELFELAGPMADPTDPTGGCFIPTQAILTTSVSANQHHVQ